MRLLVLVLVLLSINSYSQRKGFYFNLSANTYPSNGLHLGGSGNIGYSFGRQTVSVYSYIGRLLVNPVCLEHNFNFQMTNKLTIQSIVGVGIFTAVAKPNPSKKIGADFAYGISGILGIQAKFYQWKKYCLTANVRTHLVRSKDMDYPIQEAVNLAPVTFGIGFGK